MPKLKICGLKRPQDIQYVNRFSPDYIGFVFAHSKRRVTPRQAEELRRQLKPGIIPVGVFVNEQPDTIAKLVKQGIIDVVQLHGDESPEYAGGLRERIEKEVGEARAAGQQKGEKEIRLIKAVRVRTSHDITAYLDYPADFLLFDTYTREQYGGSGESFNWQLLKEAKRPFFLAGGLRAENIEKAAAKVRPFCLDVSSGAETEGVKDEEKIRKLAEIVRRMEKQELF